MKKLFVLSVILSAALLNATTNKELKAEAKAAIKNMGQTLQAEMKKNMKSGGALKAAQFCSKEATNIEKDINSKYKKGVTVKRVSLKYRNPENAPTDDEAMVLKQMQRKLKDHKNKPSMKVMKIADNYYKVYKPIFVNKKVCLKCHGDSKHRDQKAYKEIKKAYPHDKAKGYKIGDFRGAFVVEIKK